MTDSKRSSWPSSSTIVTVIFALLCLGEFIRVELLLKEHVTRIRDLESKVQTNRQQHDAITTRPDLNVNPTKPDTFRVRVRRNASDSQLTDLQKLQQLRASVCNITITDMKCRAGPPGPPGRPGHRGQKGEMGFPGNDGNPGFTGRPGHRGQKGEMGFPGKSGNPGFMGPPGLKGLKGDTGEKGSLGTPGLDGIDGAMGPPGPMGLKGRKGKKGSKGSPGFTGRDGIMGPPGLRGQKGEMGFPGKDGLPGLKGERGEKGEQGLNGTSGSTGNPGLSISSPKISVSPQTMVINKGQTAIFNCMVRGFPQPAIGWSKVGEGNSSPLTSNSKLVIHNVRPSDAGTYRCQAKNIFGTERKTVYLAVNYFTDCAEIYKSGERQNGVYTVDPDGRGPFKVYCDMTTEGGGWTVFQRRKDGSVDFYRNWSEYKKGFGNLKGEFWLGNAKIHRLSSRTASMLRVELGDWGGNKVYAKYGSFSVGSERSNYPLTATSYSGTAGDAIKNVHNGRPFSTKDRDNDQVWGASCAQHFHGAWWYESCHNANLNGKYSGNVIDKKGIMWFEYKKHQSLKFTEMKVKPVYSIRIE